MEEKMPQVRDATRVKMDAFVDEYVTGKRTGRRFYLVGAYEAAGYTVNKNQPSANPSRLLKHPYVRKKIEEQLAGELMESQEILARFTEIARAEAGSIVELNPHGRLDISPEKVIENRRFIKSFTFDSNGNPKIEFHDAHAALRDLAKVRGLLKDGVELSGPGGGAVPVTVQIQFVGADGNLGTPVQNALPAGEEEVENWDDFEVIE